jgi:hypothetical protein
MSHVLNLWSEKIALAVNWSVKCNFYTTTEPGTLESVTFSIVDPIPLVLVKFMTAVVLPSQCLYPTQMHALPYTESQN